MSRRTTLYRRRHGRVLGASQDGLIGAILSGHGMARTRKGPNKGSVCSLPMSEAKAQRIAQRLTASRTKR